MAIETFYLNMQIYQSLITIKIFTRYSFGSCSC